MQKIISFFILLLGSLLMCGCLEKNTPIEPIIDEPIEPTIDEPIEPTIDEPTEPIETPMVLTLENKINLILDDAEKIRNIYSITITQDKTILAERYYNKNSKFTKNNVYSVTKSVTSLLVGIAIEQGFIESIDQSIGSFLNLESYDNQEEINKITIRHLLTMTDGITWDSNNLSGEMIALRSALDPLGYILNRSIRYQPGTHFSYSDGAAHLLSMILSVSTQMDTKKFADQYLFEPLGIVDVSWNCDQKGTPIGGCDLFLSSRDMIKIGSLVLHKGMYNDTKIVSEEWINEATKNQLSSISMSGYGYYWWLSSYNSYDMISAQGWGGQQIYIVPKLDLVVTTSSNGWVPDSSAISQFNDLEKIVVKRIIPLVVQEQS